MEMARLATSFSTAVKHALVSVGQEDLILKPKQIEVLEAVYDSSDCFVWFPTGYGKSICYQLLPFLFDIKLGTQGCVVIVISPLVSLMVDQVTSLRSRGVL